jgi:hypothetical protein
MSWVLRLSCLWWAEEVLFVGVQLHGLANFATGHKSGGEGLAGPEGQAWRDCFEIFYNKIIRHMEALQQVCKVWEVPGACGLRTLG